jgi:hypothetical protein
LAAEPCALAFMQWIAASFGWALDCPRRDVALFSKPLG